MTPRKSLVWLWMLPVFLIAAVFAVRQFKVDAFSPDEVASMIVAGGAHYGPFSPLDAWNRVAEHSPEQAVGLALILSSWGRIFGWTEFATRTLPLFAGLLCIAWVYRSGRDLFSPRLGLAAALILASSVFFVTYMHILRVFTLVALSISVSLWCYWRIVRCPRPPGLAPQVGLLIGGIGLFYSHYFAIPFAVALGLYHLFLAPRSRDWWRAIWIALMIFIFFLPEVSVLLIGYTRNLGREDLHAGAMPLDLSFQRLIFAFSNGAWSPGPILTLTIGAALVLLALYSFIRQRSWLKQNIGYLLVLTLLTFFLIALANHLTQVMTPRRLRYLMPMWPLLALLLGAVLVRLMRWRWYAGGLLLTGWIVFGLGANLTGDLPDEFDELPPYPLHLMRAELAANSLPDDLLIVGGMNYGNARPRDYYTTYGVEAERKVLGTWDDADSLREALTVVNRVWQAAVRTENLAAQYEALQSLLEDTFTHCDQLLDERGLQLDLYARSPALCPGGDGLIRFGEQLQLIGLETVQEEDLQIYLGWVIAPDFPDNTYSMALHLYSENGELVAQDDSGLMRHAFLPLHRTLSLDYLQPGDYELRLGVYAWESGEHLPGSDPRLSLESPWISIFRLTLD